MEPDTAPSEKRKRTEAETLERLITQVARSRNASGREASSGEANDARPLDSFEEFLKYRYSMPLRSFTRRGPWYGRAFTSLSIAAIVGALASSSIAAGGDDLSSVAQSTVLVLGLFVAAVTALNQFWKPGQRSVRSYQAASSLRRLGWEFVHSRGKYGGSEEERKGTFIDEVMSIHAQAEALDQEVPPPPPGSQSS
jgi:hypothetical protein